MRPSAVFASASLALLLAALPVSARESIRLANNPALSPDGALLAFDWNGDVWTAPTNGGAARQLTQHPGRDREPKFSPDGKEIAFISDRDGSPQVYVVPVAGGTPRQITFHTAGHTLEEWLPDGKSLLVSGQRDHFWRHAERFWIVRTDERTAERVLFDDHGKSGAISPDGKRLLFSREGETWWRKGYHGSQASQVWMYDLDSKTATQLLAPERGARWPLWRPDGKAFYYVGGQGGAWNLREYDLETKKDVQVTKFSDGDDSVVFPCISRDGSTIVFRRLFDLYVHRVGSKEPPTRIELHLDADRVIDRRERKLLNTATQVAFSADGLDIAFIAGGDLWVMDTELREPKQITRTPEEERDPVFAPDGASIYFVSETKGQPDVWKAERADAKKYWFLNDSFSLSRITDDAERESGLRFTPDGKAIAFVRGRGDLWTMRPDGKDAKRLLTGFTRPQWDFSPDGKWLVYAQDDNDFNRDVWIKPLDDSREPFNLSRHPRIDANPTWSPDGKVIAFTGQRGDGKETDIYYVFLQADDSERTSRDRTLDKAIDKMKKARPEPRPTVGARPEPKKDEPPDEAPKKEEAKKEEPKKTATNEIVIDWDGLLERIRRVSIPDSTEDDLFWSPDGKKLAFRATVDGRSGLYTIDPVESPTPTLHSTATGSQMRWLPKANLIAMLTSNVPATVSGVRSPVSTPTPTPTPTTLPRRGSSASPTETTSSSAGATLYSFSARHEIDLGKKYAAAFELAWRTMRDNYYDDRLGNRDWEAVRKKYLEMAGQTPDAESLATVVNLMLGELNGSHLGFYPGGMPGATTRTTTGPSREGWRDETVHLGIRFDSEYAGPGLKVRDVLPKGPADQKRSRINAGDVVLSIDGSEIGPKTDLTTVLNGPMPRDVTLKVRGDDGQEREVTLRPITYAAARTLLYDKWLADNRKMVDQLSNGTLGYLHISGMNMPSFYKFEEELYAVGYGKDGLVIDVRENGGGSTADHLLTALTQPVHAIAVPRGGGPGYPNDRKVYATWNKPIIVLCNQNSFSNAEIFSHAIKTLKRGQLVGVPTAGGVISTGGTSIMDVGFLRLPFRGWYVVADGKDMELNGATPHHIVWPNLEELPRGKDTQIEKAVAVLLDDVKTEKARPQPELKKAPLK